MRFYGGAYREWGDMDSTVAKTLFNRAIALEAAERLDRITDAVVVSGRVVNQDEYRSVISGLERRASDARGIPSFVGFDAAKNKAAEAGLI